MKKIKITKETLGIALILILSAILNFANISIEGYGNGYYASGVKSMTMSLKNFFFVSFDPGSFVTIDKPPVGFWIQTIFAKIFGFSGWSILLPQALAGVISVYLVYYLVKRSFGSIAGLISGLCLSVTPVFVAASRNNTIDNLLVVTLLFSCLALTISAERGKSRYLYISLLLVGIGFNIKMLEAYMIGPALYITYLLSSTISFKKKIAHLVIGTIILFAVSLSWAVIVDLVPSQNRPYVGSSTNNSVMELILGHNGMERLGFSSQSGPGGGGAPKGDNKDDGQGRGPSNGKGDGNMQPPNGDGQSGQNGEIASPGYGENAQNGDSVGLDDGKNGQNSESGNQGGGPGGQGGRPGNQGGGLQGTFGGQTPAGITRLFSKNILSDQIVWFIPLALLGFLAGAIKEKLRFKLDNRRKISLSLWIVWLVPEFIYFSFTTGLFHPYYLSMMAPPIAALAGIGISTMWQFYKEGSLKSWFLIIAFVVEGLTHMLMLSYFYNNLSALIRSIIIASLVLCFIATAMLSILNILTIIKSKNNTNQNIDNLKENNNLKLKKALVGISLIGILVTPFIGSSAAITHSVNSSIPCAGLELLSNSEKGNFGGGHGDNSNSGNTKLIEFLKSNKTNEKYLLVVSSSQSAQNIIIETGESVMALGGFSGSDNILTLDHFKELVKNGEVRYVLTGGMGGRGNGGNEIMNWVTQNGKVANESEYKDSTTSVNPGGFGGGNNSEQLYDLKDVAN